MVYASRDATYLKYELYVTLHHKHISKYLLKLDSSPPSDIRYYEDPFKKENLSHGGGLKRMCLTYVEGLCWVMKYYYQVRAVLTNCTVLHSAAIYYIEQCCAPLY